MIKKIDSQLATYDDKVGSSLNVIESNAKGQITLADLQRAMRVIKHAPPEDVIENLGKKLDVDQDGLVVSLHDVTVTLGGRADEVGAGPCRGAGTGPRVGNSVGGGGGKGYFGQGGGDQA
jgi:LETM1 and EF-hand domain-containing protein 1